METVLKSVVTVIVLALAWGSIIGITGARYDSEFSGAIIGAAGTIFAGWLAWQAVQRQIEFDREIVAERMSAGIRAIENEMRPTIEALDVIWTALDETFAFQGTDEEKSFRLTWLLGILQSSLPSVTVFGAAERFVEQLAPDRRRPLLELIERIRKFYSDAAAIPERIGGLTGPPFWNRGRTLIGLLRVDMHLIKRALLQYDPNAALWMPAAHINIAITNSTYADQYRVLFEVWRQQEEDRRRANH